eukprot:401410-Amphidinium_carterae.1
MPSYCESSATASKTSISLWRLSTAAVTHLSFTSDMLASKIEYTDWIHGGIVSKSLQQLTDTCPKWQRFCTVIGLQYLYGRSRARNRVPCAHCSFMFPYGGV